MFQMGKQRARKWAVVSENQPFKRAEEMRAALFRFLRTVSLKTLFFDYWKLLTLARKFPYFFSLQQETALNGWHEKVK